MNVVFWLLKSSKTELKVIAASLTVLLLLPLISVVVFANAGLQLVGEALAKVNPVSRIVEIFDPNGHKVAEIEVSTVWPVKGYVSDEFGAPRKKGIHLGIDIANERGRIGDPVTTFMIGKVIKVDDVNDSDCGKNVWIDHGNKIISYYCHLSETLAVEKQDVEPGDIIGLEGSTGESSGPHVHFQINVYGIPVNPRIFVSGEPERNAR